jgi:hypothetical protein
MSNLATERASVSLFFFQTAIDFGFGFWGP